MKYRKKPVIIDAITFEEFIEYGKTQCETLVNGMPWSFKYGGFLVKHIEDDRYIIPSPRGNYEFTPDDMLITGVKGEIYPCAKELFELTYERI